VPAGYGCGVPLITNLIARAAGRSLGLGGRAILLGLGREAQRQYRARPRLPLDSGPAASIPRDALVTSVYMAWLCGLAAFALVVLNVHLFLPAGKSVAVFQLVVGAVLLVEGLGLVMKSSPFRRLLLTRLAPRSHRTGGRLRLAGWPRFIGATLTVLGLVWIGAGVLNLLRGASALWRHSHESSGAITRAARRFEGTFESPPEPDPALTL
jgi:hypothetical protein